MQRNSNKQLNHEEKGRATRTIEIVAKEHTLPEGPYANYNRAYVTVSANPWGMSVQSHRFPVQELDILEALGATLTEIVALDGGKIVAEYETTQDSFFVSVNLSDEGNKRVPSIERAESLEDVHIYYNECDTLWNKDWRNTIDPYAFSAGEGEYAPGEEDRTCEQCETTHDKLSDMLVHADSYNSNISLCDRECAAAYYTDEA